MASAREVFPSTPRFFPNYLASQAGSAAVASEAAVASREAVSLKVSLARVAVERVVSPVVLAVSKASISDDKGPRTTMAAARQPIPLMMATMIKQSRDKGEETVELNRKTTANTAKARHRGGVLRQRRPRPRVTRNCSSSARSAWSC